MFSAFSGQNPCALTLPTGWHCFLTLHIWKLHLHQAPRRDSENRLVMFYATFGYFVLSRGHPSFPLPPPFVFGDFKRGTATPWLVCLTWSRQKKEKKKKQELNVIMVTVMHRPPSVTVSLQLAGIFFILSHRSHIRGLKTGFFFNLKLLPALAPSH